MGERKLYEVTVRFTYYAEAETPQEAHKHATAAWNDDGADYLLASEVVYCDQRLSEGWLPESLIYGTKEDIELGEWMAQLPSRKAE